MHRRDEILARTDPFDLSQAIDRYVHTLSADRVRALVLNARERLGAYYRAEFARLLTGKAGAADAPQLAGLLHEPWSDEALQSALATLLKTNLRAIPIFGPAFCDAVLEEVPGDRTVAIGEERRPPGRALAFAGIAAVLIVAGGVGEHFLTGRAAQPPPVVTYALPSPAASPTHRPAFSPRHASRIAIAPQPSTPAPQTAAPVQVAVPPPTAVPRPTRRLPTPRPAQGVATVVIPQATATPEPSPLDVTDMPQSYTDATPLPQVSAPPADVPRRLRLVTPTPQPRRHHWLYRSIMHLDPFKPHPHSTP